MTAPHTARPPGRRMVATLMAGTLLNPLNSSVIAVALVAIEQDFSVGIGAATWLISGYYLTAAIGQSLAGRLGDRLGPRRMFRAGLALLAVTSVAAPFAPTFGVLIAIRALQALGTAPAFPSALSIVRAHQPEGHTPAGTLAALAVANSVSAALGPVLGGVLVASWGWQAVFVVNGPVALAGLVMSWRWLPPDAVARPRASLALLRALDPPGVALFAATLGVLLSFLLSLPGGARWFLLPVALVAGAGFVWRELRAPEPFVNLRILAGKRTLLAVYGQYALVNVIFYSVFFGLPLWLEGVRGFGSATTGLLMMPIAALGVVTTPLAARMIGRVGIRPPLVIGAVALTAGSLLLLTLGPEASVPAIIAVGAVLGIPNGFNNMGLQSALYEEASPERMGIATGLFQTSRYVGAIMASSVLGIAFGQSLSTGSLHAMALLLGGLGVLVVVSSVRIRSGAQSPSARS